MSVNGKPGRPKIVIIGCGGHGRVVGDALLAGIEANQTKADLAGWIDGKFARNVEILGRPVLGGDDAAATLAKSGAVDAFVIGVGSLKGGATTRQKIAANYAAIGLPSIAIVHPGAVIARDVTIGEGTVVMAGAVINVGCNIGRHVILNTRCAIDHDARIADFVHIAPGVTLSGDVQIGEAAHIGTGAVILQGIKIGAGAMVAAGSVVVADVPDGQVVMGVPARPA